jgi:DNA-binding MarR family transcriptional regulator
MGVPPYGVDPLSDDEYIALARFRKAVRLFLGEAEQAARRAGVTLAQHQLLLAVRGVVGGRPPTISQLADELQLAVHSVSGLVQRAQRAGLVDVEPDPADGRVRMVRLTPAGDEVLGRLVQAHHEELHQARARLLEALRAVQGED